MVLFPDELRVTRLLDKTLRNKPYQIASTPRFAASCTILRRAARTGWRQLDRPDIVDACERLQRLGYAHSIETWIDGELCGGLYGVAIGKMFYGESMFARRTDASKIASCIWYASCSAGLRHDRLPDAHRPSGLAWRLHHRRAIGLLKLVVDCTTDVAPRRGYSTVAQATRGRQMTGDNREQAGMSRPAP